MKFWSGTTILALKDNYVLVFGSNPEGRHGLGLAKQAMVFGAKYGVGRGLQGQTYALVTKNLTKGFKETVEYMDLTYINAGVNSVPKSWIRDNILGLYDCADKHPDKWFFIPYQKDSRNLNGYSSSEIIDLFLDIPNIPDNIVFHNSFKGDIKCTKKK